MRSVIYFRDGAVIAKNKLVSKIRSYFIPGVYRAYPDSYSGKTKIELIDLPEILEPISSEHLNKINALIDSFFDVDRKRQMNACGFIHKLGILLHGKQGTGKTTILKSIIHRALNEQNAIAFICSDFDELDCAVKFARKIRRGQDNLIVFFVDEIDQLFPKFEAEVKNILDGNKSLDNTLFLASTNYINKIPATLKRRPSRFKAVLEVGGIKDDIEIAKLLKELLAKAKIEADIDLLLDKLNEPSIEDIKHLVQDVIMGVEGNVKTKRNSIGFKKQVEV